MFWVDTFLNSLPTELRDKSTTNYYGERDCRIEWQMNKHVYCHVYLNSATTVELVFQEGTDGGTLITALPKSVVSPIVLAIITETVRHMNQKEQRNG